MQDNDVSKELNECYLKRCQFIIADLLSLKGALKNGKDEVKLYASQPEGEAFYCEAVWSVLIRTGLDFTGDEFDDIVDIRAKDE